MTILILILCRLIQESKTSIRYRTVCKLFCVLNYFCKLDHMRLRVDRKCEFTWHK